MCTQKILLIFISDCCRQGRKSHFYQQTVPDLRISSRSKFLILCTIRGICELHFSSSCVLVSLCCASDGNKAWYFKQANNSLKNPLAIFYPFSSAHWDLLADSYNKIYSQPSSRVIYLKSNKNRSARVNYIFFCEWKWNQITVRYSFLSWYISSWIFNKLN